MFENSYKTTDEETWHGRIDSDDDYDAFRWHQWVKLIDLNAVNEPFEGKLGIAFIGYCCDEGIKKNQGRIGAAKGPESIRKQLRNLPCSFTKDVELFDAGDIFYESGSLEHNQDILAKAIEKLLSLNLYPIVIGGGHEIALGHYNGLIKHLKKTNKKPNLGIINFDAHFDIRPYDGNGSSSGTMFRQIADSCRENDLNYSYYCLGVQKRGNTIDLFKTADRLGVKYTMATDMTDANVWPLIESLDKFIKKQDHIYMTICSDVFSSAFAPGVSAPQALGLHPELGLKFIKHILRSGKSISFDIAEVSPRFDFDHTTANLASSIIFAVVNTLAQSKGFDL